MLEWLDRRRPIARRALSRSFNLVPGGKRSIEVQAAEVLQALERCWAIAPSGPRIFEDISALVRVLEKIAENQGACLVHAFYRSGSREVSMVGELLLALAPLAVHTHSRIATLYVRLRAFSITCVCRTDG